HDVHHTAGVGHYVSEVLTHIVATGKIEMDEALQQLSHALENGSLIFRDVEPDLARTQESQVVAASLRLFLLADHGIDVVSPPVARIAGGAPLEKRVLEQSVD